MWLAFSWRRNTTHGRNVVVDKSSTTADVLLCCHGCDWWHVAAIAIETLEEAQGFAAEHAFNPVSFVAVPSSDAGFLGEPWFGPSGGPVMLAASIDEWSRIACEIVGRELTAEEWRTFVSDTDEQVPACP